MSPGVQTGANYRPVHQSQGSGGTALSLAAADGDAFAKRGRNIRRQKQQFCAAGGVLFAQEHFLLPAQPLLAAGGCDSQSVAAAICCDEGVGGFAAGE